MGEKISIIIPVYNAEKYISAALSAALGQTYENIEVIAVDDGSTDSSFKICSDFAACDSRLKLIKKQNGGVSSARNCGLDAAEGKYVIFADADDYLTKNAAEILLDAVDDADFVIGAHNVFRTSDLTLAEQNEREFSAARIKEEICAFDKLISTPWAKLFDREIIVQKGIRFDENLPLGEDHKFNLTYCRHIKKAKVVSSAVYNYRLGGMASSVKFYPNKIVLNLEQLKAYELLFGSKEEIPLAFLKRKVKDQLFGCVEHFIVHLPRKKAVEQTLSALNEFSPYLVSENIDGENYKNAEIDAILSSDAKKLVRCVFKRKAPRLIAKKLKKLYYLCFK